MKKILAIFAIGGLGAGLVFLLRSRVSRRNVQDMSNALRTIRTQATSRLPFAGREQGEPVWASATVSTLDASTPDLADAEEHPEPPRGVDSLGDYSRMASEPADEWIERLPDDE